MRTTAGPIKALRQMTTGYSGTPLAKQLGIKPETSVFLIDVPATVRKEIQAALVRELGLASGLVDIKVCAVDEDWSGLKFVFRKQDR